MNPPECKPNWGVMVLESAAVKEYLQTLGNNMSATKLLTHKLLCDNPDWRILVVTDNKKTLLEMDDMRVLTTTSRGNCGDAPQAAYKHYDAVIFDNVDSCAHTLLGRLSRRDAVIPKKVLWVLLWSQCSHQPTITYTPQMGSVHAFLAEQMAMNKLK